MTPAKMAMIVLQRRKGDESMAAGQDEAAMKSDMEAPPLEDVLSELKDALESGDMRMAAKAFRAAMSICGDSDEDDLAKDPSDDSSKY